METTEKRPKDMTPEERAALPRRSMLENRLDADGKPVRLQLSREGVRGDDLLGYWQDREGQWYFDPYGPLGVL